MTKVCLAIALSRTEVPPGLEEGLAGRLFAQGFQAGIPLL
jgi:hypothetical protein